MKINPSSAPQGYENKSINNPMVVMSGTEGTMRKGRNVPLRKGWITWSAGHRAMHWVTVKNKTLNSCSLGGHRPFCARKEARACDWLGASAFTVVSQKSGLRAIQRKKLGIYLVGRGCLHIG